MKATIKNINMGMSGTTLSIENSIDASTIYEVFRLAGVIIERNINASTGTFDLFVPKQDTTQ